MASFRKNRIISYWGGGEGVGALEKGYGRWEKKEQEAGVFRGWEAGDHVDKMLKTI